MSVVVTVSHMDMVVGAVAVFAVLAPLQVVGPFVGCCGRCEAKCFSIVGLNFAG